MPSETEIAREDRNILLYAMEHNLGVRLKEAVERLLAEHDRLKAELALMPCGHPEVLCQDVGPAYCEMCSQINDNTALLAELARLTDPQDASTHDGNTYVLAWVEDKPGRWIPFVTCDRLSKRDKWTPLPNPREKEDAHEPQE